MRRLAATLWVLVASCRPVPPGESAIRVVIDVQTAVDCVRVVASDEKKPPAISTELAVDVPPGQTRTLTVAVIRHREWGRIARVFAEGLRGGCTGLVVSRSAIGTASFGDRTHLETISLALTGTDEDLDGYVAALPDGAVYDCNDGSPAAHPGASEPCDAAADLDCDGQTGCARASCLGQRDSARRRCCARGVAPDTEAVCSDDKDDDCDGKADCADPDCADQSCDAFGRRCLALGVCACQQSSPVELDCADGRDEDCDGLPDCADPDCTGKSCRSGRCQGMTCCALDAGANAAESCADGIDNDCNQRTDCADPVCAGKPTSGGRICCAATGQPAPATETDCQNGLDDDCDGLTDCDDSSCDAKSCRADGGSGVCAAFVCRGENCRNRVDDNNDGRIDCADPLCANQTCSDFGRRCGASGCECGGQVNPIEATAQQCADGIDNDCDGKVDCADSSCAGQSCAAGKICVNGACVCAFSEPSEVSCADKADNDCDGRADCADADCAGRACSAAGGACQSNACVCSTAAEQSCQNGADDDCNGLADCADPACGAKPCGPFGRTCASGACVCPGGATEGCANGADDNCDGLVDCQDVAGCPDRTVCSAIGGKQCSRGVCACPHGQMAETACGDGLDNDCDGTVDCLDGDCANLACSATGRRCTGNACVCPTAAESCSVPGDEDCDGLADCADVASCPAGTACGPNGLECSANAVCLCPSGQQAEASCGDGTDNDCDGLADCQDPDCLGSPCGAGQAYCCGQSCVQTVAQGSCGHCSLTCPSGEACATSPLGAAACTCDAGVCPAGWKCRTEQGSSFCVECLSDDDCPAGRPRCALNTGTCYCPPGASCTSVCTSSGGCAPLMPVCAVGLASCVGCLGPSHCDGGACVDRACR